MWIQRCVFFLLVVCLAAADAKYFKFEDCSRQNGIAEVSTFQISPDPVSTKKNMTIDMGLKILQDVPPEAVLKTRYYNTIPFCEYLDMFQEQAEDLFPPDKDYGCPVKAGDYGGQNVTIQMPFIPTIARIIIGGKYRTELRLLDRRGGKELACYKIWTEIK